MNQSLKAIAQFSTILCAVASVGVWAIPRHADEAVWACRVLLPFATAILLFILIRAARKRDLAPDLLHQEFGEVFERDGFCFVPVLDSTDEGECSFEIHYQNRYAGACVCELVIQPSVKTLGVRRHDVPTVAVEIECPEGGIGIMRIPYPIKAKYQGKTMTYDVAARTRYPNGAGRMLRFREGARVGTHEHAIGSIGKAAVTLGLAVGGIIRFSRPAQITIELPSRASDSNSPGAALSNEVLWTHEAQSDGLSVDSFRS